MSALEFIVQLIRDGHMDRCPVCAGFVPHPDDEPRYHEHEAAIQKQAQALYDEIRGEV